MSFVRSRRPNGDTCLQEGTVKALQIARLSEHIAKAVIVTSDGKPDVCSTGDAASASQRTRIIQATMSANPGLDIQVHTIWVGTGSNRDAINFMRQLAAAHNGTFRQVSS